MKCGAKQWETRSWKTDYRGDLVIHAAQTHKGLETVINDLLFAATLKACGYKLTELEFGCYVCVVELFACIPSEEAKPSVLERHFGDYSEGRWVWGTRNLRVLNKPVYAPGAQGLREVSPEVKELINAQLRGCARCGFVNGGEKQDRRFYSMAEYPFGQVCSSCVHKIRKGAKAT
jgi:activating signal cointegrator 1